MGLSPTQIAADGPFSTLTDRSTYQATPAGPRANQLTEENALLQARLRRPAQPADHLDLHPGTGRRGAYGARQRRHHRADRLCRRTRRRNPTEAADHRDHTGATRGRNRQRWGQSDPGLPRLRRGPGRSLHADRDGLRPGPSVARRERSSRDDGGSGIPAEPETETEGPSDELLRQHPRLVIVRNLSSGTPPVPIGGGDDGWGIPPRPLAPHHAAAAVEPRRLRGDALPGAVRRDGDHGRQAGPPAGDPDRGNLVDLPRRAPRREPAAPLGGPCCMAAILLFLGTAVLSLCSTPTPCASTASSGSG